MHNARRAVDSDPRLERQHPANGKEPTMGPDEEDLSIDYELAEQQRARLAADGKDALDKGIKACED
ncbi:hypothetical protein [Buchananella hordeovulneris]|uniref:hypothetical protein n=1 Tax=Buchananella hordeovulneris TaxID=52770 RepID=UPI0011612BDC|nr:hypothetical protein [Buchananella hordeovulneris]